MHGPIAALTAPEPEAEPTHGILLDLEAVVLIPPDGISLDVMLRVGTVAGRRQSISLPAWRRPIISTGNHRGFPIQAFDESAPATFRYSN